MAKGSSAFRSRADNTWGASPWEHKFYSPFLPTTKAATTSTAIHNSSDLIQEQEEQIDTTKDDAQQAADNSEKISNIVNEDVTDQAFPAKGEIPTPAQIAQYYKVTKGRRLAGVL